ncbi:hypothetical protein LguiA_001843 [Lonicera macranthoides]
MHISHIWKARRSETSELDKYRQGISKKSVEENKKCPLISSLKQLDQRCSEEDNCDNCDHDNDKIQNDAQSHSKFSSHNINSSDRASSCPYPPATTERTRLGLTHETDPCPSSASGSLICNEPIQPFMGEKNISGNTCGPSNVSKRHEVEMNFPIGYEKKGGSSKKNEIDLSLPDEAVRMFLMTWKEASREKSVAEVLESMLLLYVKKKKRIVKNVFSSYPGIGLLNVAVTSMKNGMWDSICDTSRIFSQQEVSNTTSEKFTDHISTEVEPSEKNALVATEHILSSRDGKLYLFNSYAMGLV